MRNKKSIGLPNGPNEFLKDITQYISVEGYKRYSDDVNNPINIIQSGLITMEDVDFPVKGIDNLGNEEIMMPGMNYQFPGDSVLEVPMAQEGNGEVISLSTSDPRYAEYYNRLNDDVVLADPSGKTAGRIFLDEVDVVADKATPSAFNFPGYTKPTISEYVPPSTGEQLWNKVSHPMSTLGYIIRGEDMPNMIGRENAFDYAVDVVNPATYVNTLSDIGKSIGEGDIVGAGVNAITLAPGVPTAARQVKKAIPTVKRVTRNIPSKINPNYYNPNTLAKGNPNTMYREIGKDAYQDFANSGLVRTKAEITDNPILGLVKTQREIKDVLRFNKEHGQFQYRHPTDFRAPFFSRGKTTTLKKGDPDYLIQTRPDRVGPDKFSSAQWNILHSNQQPPVGGFGIMDPMYRQADNFDVFKKNWWSGYKPVKQEGGEQSFLPPAIRNMYSKEDPIYYDGMLAETTVTAPKAGEPSVMDYVNYRRQAGEPIPKSSPYHHSHGPEPINSNQSFIGADKSGGLAALKAIGKGVKGLMGLKNSADDAFKYVNKAHAGHIPTQAASQGSQYKTGFGNPYENLKVTDDLFQGVNDYGIDYDGQIAKGRLDFVRNLGKELDDAKFDANWISPEHLRFQGSPGGRSVVEVAVPGKTHQTQLFYKSSGLAGKSGSGVNGTTQGLWQPYGGHATLLDQQGPVHNWFIKDSGYKDFYNSKSFKDIAGRLDDLTKEAGFDLSGQASRYQEGGEALPKAQVGREIKTGRGTPGLLDKPYLDPGNINLIYDEDEVYESVFDPRIRESRRANKLAKEEYERKVQKRNKDIKSIEEAKALYRNVWYDDFKDTTFKTSAERKEWQENNPRWKAATDTLGRYAAAPKGLNASVSNASGFEYTPYFNPEANLTDLYPEKPLLKLPYPDIKYNLSNLPEGVDETEFRKWVNYYYPDYAVENDISSTTPSEKENDFIKSAWYELGNQYEPFKKLEIKKLEQAAPKDKPQLSDFTETKAKSKGTLVSTGIGDGRVNVIDLDTGGGFGTYDTPEQARIAMIEAYTDGYSLSNPEIANISAEDLGNLYDVADKQPAYRANNRPLTNYEKIQAMKRKMSEGGQYQTGGEHTVSEGETFYGIANKNKISWKDLEAFNPDIDINALKKGQTINLSAQPTKTKKSTEEKREPTSWTDYINPYNWGVSDRDDDGSYNQAFRAARNAGEDEFMWYGKRYTTELDKTDVAKEKEPVKKEVSNYSFQEYQDDLRAQENLSLKGWDSKRQLWFPTPAPEENGGFDIGYGHKIKKGENFSKGLTDDQVNNLFAKDLNVKFKAAKSTFNRQGLSRSWDDLNEQEQILLGDYQYNGVLGDFKKLMKAVADKDKDSMLKEYVRYQGKEKLGRRNDWTKSYIDSEINYKKGGEPNPLTIYSNYINGDYDGTDLENKAIKIYDRLNRIHYRDAKSLGMSPVNYILTHVVAKA